MENQHQFKLIEGVFSPAEASKVLFTLIQNKISYHNVQILATHERSDGDISHSEARVEALMALRGDLKELLDFANDLKMDVKVDGYFEVSLVK